MSDSDNESDFASAESDQEDTGTPVTDKDSNTSHKNFPPTQETPPPKETEPLPPAEADKENSEAQNTIKEVKTVSNTVKLTETKLQSLDEAPNEQKEKTESKLSEQKERAESEPPEQKEKAESKPPEQKEKAESKPPEQKEKAEPKPPEQIAVTKEANSGGWGWGGWGSSLWSSVSAVTESAQALGTKVSSVIASVEEGLGLPSPSELAKSDEQKEERKLAESVVEHDLVETKPVIEEPHRVSESNQTGKSEATEANYGGFFSGLASVVQSTGKDLMAGGLDALETLGKKTMEVLSEGDPGLKKKRVLLMGQASPTLSQLLEEAKNEPGPSTEEKGETPLNYSRLFDEYHGVVHLEALELLSRECATKIMGPSLTEQDTDELREKMEELESYLQVEEEQEALDDDSSKLAEILDLFSDSSLPLKVNKLIKVSNAWREKLEQTTPVNTSQPVSTNAAGTSDDQEERPSDLKPVCETLYTNGLRSLAELTSTAIELFRKISELSLLPDAHKGDPIDQAKRLNRLTVLVCSELDCLASVHSEAITQLDIPDTNSSVTSLYLEASNSSTYVQDAFQLLLPVLKLIQIQRFSSQVPEGNILART